MFPEKTPEEEQARTNPLLLFFFPFFLACKDRIQKSFDLLVEAKEKEKKKLE